MFKSPLVHLESKTNFSQVKADTSSVNTLLSVVTAVLLVPGQVLSLLEQLGQHQLHGDNDTQSDMRTEPSGPECEGEAKVQKSRPGVDGGDQ